MSDRGCRPSDGTESTRSGCDAADSSAASLAESAVDTAASPGRLVVVCGLPGVGKTTVAERVAERVDGKVLRTDAIRKELFDDPAYTDAETETVYGELLARAEACVAAGTAVVLDATFADERFREDARETATGAAAGFDLVEVVCDESTVKRRIERREGISDADFEIHLHFAELFDEIETDHVVVDNSGAQAETFAQVDAAFAGGSGDEIELGTATDAG